LPDRASGSVTQRNKTEQIVADRLKRLVYDRNNGAMIIAPFAFCSIPE